MDVNMDEDEFARVRLVRDFLSLLWDLTIRWYTWDWETAKVSFGFYRKMAVLKAVEFYGALTGQDLINFRPPYEIIE